MILWWWHSERKLCQLVTEFGRVCERKLQVNVGNSKVMRCTRNEDGARLNVMLNGEALEGVDQFKYLGSVIAATGGVEADVHHGVNEGCKVLGACLPVLFLDLLGFLFISCLNTFYSVKLFACVCLTASVLFIHLLR